MSVPRMYRSRSDPSAVKSVAASLHDISPSLARRSDSAYVPRCRSGPDPSTVDGEPPSTASTVRNRGRRRPMTANPVETRIGTIVVVPSLTLPLDDLRNITGIVFYEERLLCFLLLLADPAT